MRKITLNGCNTIPDDYRTIRTVVKKPEEFQKEIDSLYMEYRPENGHEPHYADCIIRWNDNLETEEVRIALAMDSDTEMDEEIFLGGGIRKKHRRQNLAAAH